MPKWTESMQQTYEYYTVNPETWKNVDKLDNVKSCTINRDATAETLGSATFEVVETVGESYIRPYLITIQNGVREEFPLGTFLVQTPSSSFDGKIRNVSMDAYTPLLELKESPPPLGYSLLEGDNIMEKAHMLVREHARAPVVETISDKTLFSDFVADINDNWLSFTSDLISNAKHEFALDDLGRILFSPKQDISSLQPAWTFNDDNSSILLPDITWDHDLYGIPNVVEVIYSSGRRIYQAKAVNDDPNSPTSTVNRGREIIYRVTDPDMIGNPTNYQIDEYAIQLLKELSSIEYTVSFSHGYCPVRLGDCVRLNYERAGIVDVKAKIISQSIKCVPGCTVSTKAIFTAKLWG
jgi:hypothetical protein